MAKKDLIGGSLWEQYSQKVSDRMDNPRHRGDITQEEADAKRLKLIVADYGAEACGDAVRLFWLVDPKTDTIVDAKFKSFGCGTTIDSSDLMAELCIGKTVDEAVKITNVDIEFHLRDKEDEPAIPPQKMHCSVMAYDVIKRAAAIYKGVDSRELEKEEIVCECARVSLKTVQDVIRINDLKTVEEITRFTKAGAFCKSCVQPGGHEKKKYYLVDILRETRAAMERENLRKAEVEGGFPELPLVRKFKAIEKIIEAEVRPLLSRDGGDLEIVDVKENPETVEVYIRYSGACLGCMSSGRGTLMTIQSILQERLSPKIRVITL